MTAAPLTAEKPSRARRLWPLAAAVVLGVTLVVAALAIHGYASSLDQAARTSNSPAAERAGMAHDARRLEPWNERFAVTEAVVRAQLLLSKGRVDEAYFLLLPLSKTVRDDPVFRETYQQALAKKLVIDARKAHQQHAREAEDGALAPEDVIR